MDEEMKGIDRRSFLAGAGILAAAGVAGAVAGCSPSTSTDGGGTGGGSASVAPAVDTSGYPWAAGAYPWAATPPTIAATDIEEEITTDIVVAGAGISGACAIRAAAEEGAKVVFFEKAGAVTSSSGQMAVIGGKVQAKWGRDGIIDIKELVDHEMDEGSYFGKRAIWSKWAEHVHEVFDWYIASGTDILYGEDMDTATDDVEYYVTPLYYPAPQHYDWTKEKYPTYPQSVACSQGKFNIACVEKATAEGDVTAYFNHAVQQLIKEGGRVTGCYAYNYDTKKYKKVTASKGVILATGDISGNKEMIAYFTPAPFKNGNSTMYPNVDPEGVLCNQGDALKMTNWVGARIQPHFAPMIHHMGMSGDPDEPRIEGASSFGASPWLRLDKHGNRFMNEDVPGQQIENQIEALKDYRAYQICDANWKDQVSYFPAAHGVVCYYNAGDAVTRVSDEGIAISVEAGTIYSGNTIDELLDAIDSAEGIDKATAKKSIERYNELARAGEDLDFGKVASRMFPLEAPPFYCARLGLAEMLCVLGGPESDEYCRTYDENRDIIPGLYVTGNAQGSRYTIQYPIALEGAASSMGMYYGYVAGKSAANGV